MRPRNRVVVNVVRFGGLCRRIGASSYQHNHQFAKACQCPVGRRVRSSADRCTRAAGAGTRSLGGLLSKTGSRCDKLLPAI